jgi:RNA polymerase sigma-70 factor (ECF subfamily)
MTERNAGFATTHWSLVFAAARQNDVAGREALATLCEQYWYPLYVYVRRRGYTPEDAQDLTQAFFARLLDKGDVARATPTRGRFRSFLLTSLHNFLLNEFDRHRTLKRGGGTILLSLDLAGAEQRYRIEPVSTDNPDEQFNRKWALTVLEHALRQLRNEHDRDGKSSTFARLAGLITGGTADDSYRAAATDLAMNEGAVRVAVHRMRRRFRDILRAEVAQTVDPAEMDDEIQFLIRAAGGKRA